MRIAWLVGFCVFGVGSVASAQPVPKQRVGFQMALRSGFAAPLGSAAEDRKMSDITTGQVPLFVEIGGKLTPNLFLGGYLGIAFGGANGVAEDVCELADTCISVGTRAGGEIQYHFLPRELTNPWIGYGIGFESLVVAWELNDEDGSVGYSGVEYARLSAGVDFRLSRVFGLGPFVDFSVGEYLRYHLEGPGPDRDGSVDEGAAHTWLTLGVRGVFFP